MLDAVLLGRIDLFCARRTTAQLGVRGLRKLAMMPSSYLTPKRSSSLEYMRIMSWVAFIMVLSELQSQKKLMDLGFSMRQDRQDRASFLSRLSQIQRNYSSTYSPSLSRNCDSLFRDPRIAFHRQSRIDTAKSMQRAEVARLGSLRLAMMRSMPPLERKSFLFLGQSLQRLLMMEKQSSLMSRGFSSLCCRNQIRLSMTPSSLILSLYCSSNRLALLKARRQSSLRSGSLVLARNLVRQKRPFFSSKSSFMKQMRLARMARQCSWISRSWGADHRVTAQEVVMGSMQSSRYLMKLTSLIVASTRGQSDWIAVWIPLHTSFLNYRSSMLVPYSAFLSAILQFGSVRVYSSTVAQPSRHSRKLTSPSSFSRKQARAPASPIRQLMRMSNQLRRHLSSSLYPSAITFPKSCLKLAIVSLLAKLGIICCTPKASIAFQIMSRHSFTIEERKSGHSKTMLTMSCRTPFSQIARARFLKSRQLEHSSSRGNRNSQFCWYLCSTATMGSISRLCWMVLRLLVPFNSRICIGLVSVPSLRLFQKDSSLRMISLMPSFANLLRKDMTAKRRGSRGSVECFSYSSSGMKVLRKSGTRGRYLSSSELLQMLKKFFLTGLLTSSSFIIAPTISSTPRNRSPVAYSTILRRLSIYWQKKPSLRPFAYLTMAAALRSCSCSLYSFSNISRTSWASSTKGSLLYLFSSSSIICWWPFLGGFIVRDITFLVFINQSPGSAAQLIT